MGFLNNLDWRYAVKEFDNTKKISKENLDKILNSIQYSPSSYGLQSYHVYVISDNKIKAKIKLKSFLQKQIISCSHLLIFCARIDKEDMSKRVDDYVELSTDGNRLKKLKMQPIKLMMKGSLKAKSDKDHASWASKQAYITLGFAMAAAAELQIDSCPMEGFDKKGVGKILDLPPHLETAVMLPIGYRKEEPSRKKVRFSKEDLFTNL